MTAFAAGKTVVTILGTADLHGNIWGFSYEDQKETTNNGLARVATYVKQQREQNPNLILRDAGDAVQGTILTDDLYNKTNALEPDSEPHIMMAAMNALEYCKRAGIM